MRSFKLTFEDDEFDVPRLIEFEATAPYDVFHILQRQGSDRMATLWEGEKRLGTLKLTDWGFWQLMP